MQGRYGGAIGAFWQAQFGAAPPAARVLDIACGNGALARLLQQTRSDERWHCDAVDLARVAPVWAATEPRVHFHPGLGAEALPFASGHFDLVVSQYGIEYSDMKRSLHEALRVCRPGGTLAFGMHHAGARPCVLAREELGHLDWLLAGDGWLAAARDMLEPMRLMASHEGRARLAAQAERYGAMRSRFDECTAALHARRKTSLCPDVLVDAHNRAVQAFRAANADGAQAGELALQGLAAMLQDIRERLRDLSTHALDEPGLAAVVDTLRADGRDVDRQDLHDRLPSPPESRAGSAWMAGSLVAGPRRPCP